MANSIFKINKKLPRLDQVGELNDMVIINEGGIKQGKFDKNELSQIFTDLGLDRKFAYRDTVIGGTTSSFSNWSHVTAEDGYGIWKFAPTNYEYNSNNELYFDNKILSNKGQADSETDTSFTKVFLYNGDSGSGYTDNTTEAASEGGTEFNVMDSTNDYLYCGITTTTFAGVKFEWQTRGSGITLKVEYYDSSSGDGWTELTANTNSLDDDTSNFESNGRITWSIPSDWVTTSVNSTSAYWIRISTTTTPTTTAKAYSIIPGNCVNALLALSNSEIQNETWAWCSYNGSVYVTIRNDGNTSYEGNYYITSSSSSTNLENFFVHNHTYTASYEDSTYVVPNYVISNINNYVETKTASYSISSTDNVILADATGLQELRIDLPSAHGLKGKRFTIKAVNIDSGTAGIIIDAMSGETIDGLGTKSLTSDYSFMTLVSDDLNWYIISQDTQVL